ncbi:MAG: ribulose-phosphate 3-epimerase [Bacteroidales bacterium]|nr:ribulose-phosphate 3-epimerase [Bacteroidales bacterium]MBO7479227.1 ribulose-phosphate 3-epimerase [Bacteroidales bacterium]
MARKRNMIAPSILSADFGHLERDIEMLNESSCDWIHLDVMDGVFVPNISFGFPVLKPVAKVARKPLDAHLMIVEPEKFIKRFADLGVDYLSVHYETCPKLRETIAMIRENGMKPGVVVNPDTEVKVLKPFLKDVEYVLIMSVYPGFGGQSFIPHSVDKVKELKAMRKEEGASFLIEIDGGINLDNVAMLREAGVDIFVAGNTVFSAEDPKACICRMAEL